jgi:hypothetical protein
MEVSSGRFLPELHHRPSMVAVEGGALGSGGRRLGLGVGKAEVWDCRCGCLVGWAHICSVL